MVNEHFWGFAPGNGKASLRPQYLVAQKGNMALYTLTEPQRPGASYVLLSGQKYFMTRTGVHSMSIVTAGLSLLN